MNLLAKAAIVVGLVAMSAACNSSTSATLHFTCLGYIDAQNDHRDVCSDLAPVDDSECDAYIDPDLDEEEAERVATKLRCLADAWETASKDPCSKPVIDCDGTSAVTDVQDDCLAIGGGAPASCDITMDLASVEASLDPNGALDVFVSVHGDDFLDPMIYSSFVTVEVEDMNGTVVASCSFQYHQGVQDQFCVDVGGVLGPDDDPEVIELGSDILLRMNLATAGSGPFTIRVKTGWTPSFTAAVAEDTAEVSQVTR
jgi:hypothetical protein